MSLSGSVISVTISVQSSLRTWIVKMRSNSDYRGRTIYGHYPLSYLGQSKFLFNMEKERLSRMGVNFISWIKPMDSWILDGFVPTVVIIL